MLAKPVLTGASERRERSRQEMRSAILDAAGTIMAAEGVDGLTIRAVAQAVGYSAGALYEYFDSKEAILTALYFEGAGGLQSYCEQAVKIVMEGASAVDALTGLGHAYRSYALANPELYRLIFSDFKSVPKSPGSGSHEESTEGFDTLVRVMMQGVAERSMIDLPPVELAMAAWAAVHGFVSLELANHVTGGDGPGMPPASPEAGRERRDQMFDAMLRIMQFGFVSEEQRTKSTTE